jgi:hypothetical protein
VAAGSRTYGEGMRSPTAIVARWTQGRVAEGPREVAIFALAYFVYFGVRAMTEGAPATAMRHADALIGFERHLGMAWERVVQDGVVRSRFLLDAANAVYMYGHWPVIIVTGVMLYRYRRQHYYELRNACLVSGLVGLAIFALYPVAPPRLTDLPLVDTVTAHAEGYRQLVPKALVNQYAAMPSFHAGWNVLLGIVVFRATRNRLLRALAIVGPATMVLAVVATANHFVIDVVAGVTIVLLGLLAVHTVERRARRRTLDFRHELSHGRVLHRRPPCGQRSGEPPGRREARTPARRS